MKSRIIVTGDVVVDHHIYEGKRYTASAIEQPGVRVIREHGGAMALTRLIAEVIGQTAPAAAQAKNPASGNTAPTSEWSVDCPIKPPAEGTVPCGHHALAVWKPFPVNPSDRDESKKVWRADLLMGYGHDEPVPSTVGPACGHHILELMAPQRSTPRVLVLDDAGFLFRRRTAEKCWLLPKGKDGGPDWVVLKMSGPVCQGDLWHRLTAKRTQRLIVVVSANELRQECVRLGAGLSWERTVEDLREALQSSSVLKKLTTIPRHLVVTFSADGALWLDNTGNRPRAALIFDAAGADGAWARPIQGKAFGYLTCMVAAISRAIMLDSKTPEFAPAIRTGLACMRDLLESGHGASSDPPSGFPVKRLAKIIVRGSSAFAEMRVPWTDAEWAPYAQEPGKPAGERHWRIVEMSQRPFASRQLPSLLGLATQTVLQGEAAISRLPHARFRKLLTADRFEIEALRSIERLMTQYRNEAAAKKPLSIGVFGPSGAGKSFGVKQLTESVFGELAWREFNLSQFKDEGDLVGAFHQIRDVVLSGVTPVAFWDEFDSREYFWLQYLLAPMQDGRFQEGQISHAIGKCVFIFAGATSSTFESFGPQGEGHEFEKAQRTFCLRKGPDFHSRLDAYMDVLGPNRRTVTRADENGKHTTVPDEHDVCAPLRRALLIRAHLGVPKAARIEFDPDLLAALLRSPSFLHGARSIEKLVTSLRPTVQGQPVRRSALPPEAQLAMHVDVEAFNADLNENASFRQDEVTDALAPAIHETWRHLSKKEGWKMQPHLDKPYKQLVPTDQEDNRAAARRIPAILALAGLGLKKAAGKASAMDAAILDHLEHHMERLAEAEHDGWMDQRLRNDWRWAKQRNDALKLHPALVPYEELSERDQKKDKNSVRMFPEMVKLAGYRIVWV